MLATLATTVLLFVAPGGEANPACPRTATGYDFGLSVAGHQLTNARSERGGLVFGRQAVVLTARHGITIYNTGRRWLRVSWSCES
jgi:hypothetical protein